MELGQASRLLHRSRVQPLTPLRFQHVGSVARVSFGRRAQRGMMLAGGVESMAMQPILVPASDVLELWRSAEAVCFDVDSTVCVDEGIDELAGYSGAGEAVASWTAKAMDGAVTFQEALAARLDLFRPSLSLVNKYLADHPPRLTPGIRELVQKLHSRGKEVYLVSGGFRQMIEPAAALLNINKDNIFANRLLFDESGNFDGFDEDEPTSRSGGKAIAIAQIKKVWLESVVARSEVSKQKHGYKRLVMIGDGVTDLEARMPGGADIFICFAGVQMRPNVAAAADWCVTDFATLAKGLD